MPEGLLILNIRCLVQTEDFVRTKISGDRMSELSTMNDAFLYIRNGIILDFGRMKDLDLTDIPIEDPQIKQY